MAYGSMTIKKIKGKRKVMQMAFPNRYAEWYLFNELMVCVGIMFLFLNGCAKVGTPTGGQKDINLPVYVEGIPEDRSTNFNGEEIDITFNEYIQLKDQNKELLISPPLKKRPVVRVKDKSIRITLNNELLPQTTYTVNFGNAISDNNEGNILPDFEFVFSTGSSIDSLSVTGKVLNAFDKKPAKNKDEEVLVMLYENLSDSAPLLEIPRYIGKASKAGLFSINNVHADTFRILALKDVNSNRLYDPGSESVAFSDSFLIINAGTVKPVTFIKDTVKIVNPGTKTGRSGKQASARTADTTIVPGKKLNAMNVSLLYFQEESNKVFLVSKKRESTEKLHFTFSRTPHDTIKLTPLNFKPYGDWFVKEASSNGDSLTYWITDTLIARQDTLKLTLAYLTKDSADRFIERIDTVVLKFQKETETNVAIRRNRNAAPVVKKEKVLSVKASISDRGVQNLNKPIVFTTERPLGTVKPEDIELFSIEDSLVIKQPFIVLKDSFNIKAFTINCEWKEDRQYKLLLKPGVITDIYGLANDSIALVFSTQKEDYYGRILLTVGGAHYPMLVQLIDDKEKIIDVKYIRQTGATVFDYLPPKKYILKAIYDKNENRKWDTGNYLKHLQPEQVYYFPKSIELRSNWDVQEDWMISE